MYWFPDSVPRAAALLEFGTASNFLPAFKLAKMCLGHISLEELISKLYFFLSFFVSFFLSYFLSFFLSFFLSLKAEEREIYTWFVVPAGALKMQVSFTRSPIH